MHYKRTNFNIAFSGMMLSLTLLFQYLERFMPIVPFLMSVNISVVFVLLTYTLTNYKFGTFVLLMRFLLTPFISGSGILAVDFFGSFVALIAASIYIHLILMMRHLKTTNFKYPIVAGLISATIVSTMIMVILNGVLFVPMWSYVAGWGFNYGGIAGFGISSYWPAVIAIYTVGNIANFGLSSIIFWNIRKAVRTFVHFDKIK